MVRNFYIVIIMLSLTACLQEPAPIVGKRNYYIDETDDSTDNLVNKNVLEDKDREVKTLDPYADGDISSEPNHEIDWNKLFDEENKDGNKSKKDLDVEEDIKFNEANTTKGPKNEPQAKKEAQPEKINRKIEPQSKPPVKKDKPEKTIQNVKFKIIRPVKGEIKVDNSDSSDGVIFETKDKNILSVGSGRVIYLDDEKSHSEKTIVTKLDNGFVVSYSFKGHAKITLDSKVTPGQIIGEIGDESEKLYCSIRQNGKKIDPRGVME